MSGMLGGGGRDGGGARGSAMGGKGAKRGAGKRKAVTMVEENNTVHEIPSRAEKRTRTEPNEAGEARESNQRRIEGYSLDSDDEDEEAAEVLKSRYVLKDEDEHEKLDETFQDGGVRVTAFNLEEEEEEGYFDASGNYFLNKKDENHEGDNWLDDAGQYVPKSAEVVQSNYREAAEDPQKRDRAALLSGMLKHMQPRETAQQAMRRLGGPPAPSQRRWQKKKAGKAEKSEAAPKKTAVDEAAFAELTACTDELLADGEFDVYSYSYEKVAYEIKELESAPVAAVEDNTGPKFEYKWSEDALETYGPYTAKQMLSWQEQAFFKDGAVCREIKEGSETRWYSAKRVDFDLYID